MEIKLKIELGEDYNKDELKALEVYFLEQQKPLKFDPYDPENVLSRRENEFMEICHSMEENGVHRPGELTEFAFYSKLKFYDKRYQQLKNKTK